jgi:hypothetical protein
VPHGVISFAGPAFGSGPQNSIVPLARERGGRSVARPSRAAAFPRAFYNYRTGRYVAIFTAEFGLPGLPSHFYRQLKCEHSHPYADGL